jgi:import receptor subunit TOM20
MFEHRVDRLNQIVMEMTNLDVSSPSSSIERELPEEDESSPVRTGPPSEASSQEWDKLTDPGS